MLEDTRNSQDLQIVVSDNKTELASSFAGVKDGSLSGTGTGQMDDDGNKKNMSSEEEVQDLIRQFNEMIEWMDLKFEAAFQQKDKEFMIAYREHVQDIQKELNDLKDKCNDQVFMTLKKKKIESLEKKLG